MTTDIKDIKRHRTPDAVKYSGLNLFRFKSMVKKIPSLRIGKGKTALFSDNDIIEITKLDAKLRRELKHQRQEKMPSIRQARGSKKPKSTIDFDLLDGKLQHIMTSQAEVKVMLKTVLQQLGVEIPV